MKIWMSSLVNLAGSGCEIGLESKLCLMGAIQGVKPCSLPVSIAEGLVN